MFKQRFIITSNYKVLHFDEWDILFVGKNAYNEWVIGSLAYDDEENNIQQHYYLIVSEQQLIHFLRQDITLRLLFSKATKIFKTISDINGYLIGDYQELEFENINKNSLPAKNSTCPLSNEQKDLLKQISKHKLAFSNDWKVFSNLEDVKETKLPNSKNSNYQKRDKSIIDRSLVNKNTNKYKSVK